MHEKPCHCGGAFVCLRGSGFCALRLPGSGNMKSTDGPARNACGLGTGNRQKASRTFAGLFLRPLPFQTAEIRHTVSVTNTRPELKKREEYREEL